MEMMSQRKEREAKKRFITSKFANFLAMSLIFTVVMGITPVFAAGELDTAKSLLSKAATAGGGLWAVWGLVQLGMGLKDHNGPGIQGAIWQIIGGASNPMRSIRPTAKYQILPINL